MKLTRDMIDKQVVVRIVGVTGKCTVQVVGFGTCGKWCRLVAIDCTDKKFCCGEEQSFPVAVVKVLSIVE